MKMKMKMILMLALVLLQLGLSVPSALLWSPHYRVESSVVNYQTLSPKDVAESLVSNLMHSQHKPDDHLALVLVFVGKELHSSDFHADNDLVKSLKVSYTRSNFSMAFPYIAASEDETLPDSLLSGFTASSNVAFSESCPLPAANPPKLSNSDSVDDYLALRAEKRAKGEADVLVFCHKGSTSEGETFAKLVNSMDRSGERYAILYVSDSYKPTQYPSYREVERFLAETTNVTGCGEVCKIKSSLLEGLFVGIVLLIILISGICCMMGIDTPTRFETPQDS